MFEQASMVPLELVSRPLSPLALEFSDNATKGRLILVSSVNLKGREFTTRSHAVQQIPANFFHGAVSILVFNMESKLPIYRPVWIAFLQPFGLGRRKI